MSSGCELLKPSELVPGAFLARPGDEIEYSIELSEGAAKISRRQKRPSAANGQQAFVDTDQFRNDYPPDNYPTSFSAGGIIANFVNGSCIVQFAFAYVQGSNIATSFALYLKYGGGTILASDPHFLVSAGAGGTINLPFTTTLSGTWRFGVAAVADCSGGPVFNATITQTSDTNYDVLIPTFKMGGNRPVTLYGADLYLGSDGVGGTYTTMVEGILDLHAYTAQFNPKVSTSVPATNEACMYTNGGHAYLAWTDSGSTTHYFKETGL